MAEKLRLGKEVWILVLYIFASLVYSCLISVRLGGRC
jgi:hypothetical protein